ncbi:MAG: peptide ABC transporter substrate-binding protein [Lachnospiraceae bacterium]
MKKWKKLLCVLLAATTAFSMCACGGKKDNGAASDGSGDSKGALDLSGMNYDEQSSAIYDYVLGDFYDAYQVALESQDSDERYALMAIAEAKLLESGVLTPTHAEGGTFRLTRVAPYSFSPVLWGFDQYKYDTMLVTTDFIKADDITEIRAKWNELKGTGTFREWEIQFLKDKGYKLKDTYSRMYTYDPSTWDCLASYYSTDGQAVVNTVDPLMRYDEENVLQPAVAESYEVSDDGLTYTFHIRKGIEWVDSQQRKVGELTADDFVAGMQHVCDAQGGMEYLYEGVIKNASEYLAGDITDFNEVGVKAVDDYTLEYTLEKPVPYFMSMLGYCVFYPLNREYYEFKGGKFGAEFDPQADDYKYGKDFDSIAYCGAYTIKSATEKNSIIYEQNDSYYNKDNVTIKKISFLCTDAKDENKFYNDTKNGLLDHCGLTDSLVETAKKDGMFEEYVSTSTLDATTFCAYYNLNRQAYANANDESDVVSLKSEEEKERTRAAMLNQHFRLALCYAFDRGFYNSQEVGEELQYISLRNTYTPGDLVYTEKDVTVSINGTDVTFPKGTSYGEMVQAQIEADGYPIKAYDPEADEGIGSSSGYDGWFNPEQAVAEMDKAVEELAAQGITIDEDHPIHIDYSDNSSSVAFKNRAQAYKQSMEEALGGRVVIDVSDVPDFETWGYAGYYCSYGYEMNYDMYDFTGWSPDYGEPSTFLNTLLPDYSGYCTKSLGIF